MTVERIDEEDLDEEDRAILAEVKKKGYYHGRPKSEACAPPVRIVEGAPTSNGKNAAASGGNKPSRLEYDEFQKKWDRFDRDDFVDELAHVTSSNSAPSRPAKPPEFKILLVGDRGAGKSALMRWHCIGGFDASSAVAPQAEIQHASFGTNCGDILFRVFDPGLDASPYLSGTCTAEHCAGCAAAIIMFDVTKLPTYSSVSNWYKDISRWCGPIPIVVVGNKVDVPLSNRQVKPLQIIFHRARPVQYYDMSVAWSLNVEKPFLWLARRLTNQPRLGFVGTIARPPEAKINPALREEHRRKLLEAQAVAVVDT